MKKNTKILSYLLAAFMLLTIVSCKSNNITLVPNNLSVSEGFTNPLGFYDANPTFSWKLPAGVQAQSAYEIVVASSPDLLPDNPDLWESGKVETDQNLYVQYEGENLTSRQKVYWQVKFWDQKGTASGWSEPAFFELGLLNNHDWQAKWIDLPGEKAIEIEKIKRKAHKVQYFRKAVLLDEEVENARLYITALGVFQAHINGKPIGEDVLTPGWTSYEKRVETLTYDVADVLNKGENVLGIELAEGWYAGRLIFRGYPKRSPQVLAQLEVTYKNGEKETFVSDSSWKGTSNGPTVYSSIYDGETYNAALEMPGWNAPGFNDSGWSVVAEQPIAAEVQLAPKRHSPVTTKIKLPTQNITEPTKGNYVFDLGQNIAGVAHLNIPVKKGQIIKIRFAEMLQPNGEIYTKNYRSAVSTNFYMAAEDAQIEWHPKFTFHGFRYVELSGFDESVTPEKSWVTGLVQYSDFDRSGSFSSSHSKLNQLQSNIEWGLRGNFLDIPTDCPQRDERAGWTGDAQVFIPTSMFIADAHAFWASWMQSVRDDQRDNGSIPIVVPDIDKRRVSSGWGDVATVIPWEIYIRTGDKKILEDSYTTMLGWINYYRSVSENHIPDMFTYGDWLQPYSEHPTDERKGVTDEKLINTAYYARSVDLTIKTAQALGLTDDVSNLQTRLNEIKTAFQKRFFNANGSVRIGKSTQTAYLMAIGFNLLTPEMEAKAIPHLLAEIEKADTHLRTGFLGTPLLAPVLEKIGRPEIMFEMLFKETYPSWFYSINQGATTMWERWNSYTHKDGFNPGGMNSFNHYAYGAIGQWMYERIAGVKPIKPGYKEIQIAPLPGGPLTSAEASYNSPYGEVSSAWKKENGMFELKAVVPPNTKATVIVPANTTEVLLLNGEPFAENDDMKLVNTSDLAFELEVKPGTYVFTSKLD